MNELKHIAFIMDGNGRWAKQQNKPRTYGHQHGLKAMSNIIKSCLELNIPCVSFFAFSTENWNRPISEVKFLLSLLTNKINDPQLIKWLNDNNVRFIWNGNKDKLDSKLLTKIYELMDLTKNNTSLTVQIMFNYGGRSAIVNALKSIVNNNDEINILNVDKYINPYNLPPVDLLIRTSGENRISNFMLWEISYSEIIFNPVFWPDYNKDELLKDILIYNNRVRRFGSL